MTRLWSIVQAHMDEQGYPVSIRAVARKLDMSPTAVSNWRAGITRLPEVDHLRRLSEVTNVPYLRVLDAALEDAGYTERDPRHDEASMNRAGGSPAIKRTAVDDEVPYLSPEQQESWDLMADEGHSEGKSKRRDQDVEGEAPEPKPGDEPA